MVPQLIDRQNTSNTYQKLGIGHVCSAYAADRGPISHYQYMCYRRCVQAPTVGPQLIIFSCTHLKQHTATIKVTGIGDTNIGMK